MHACQIIYSFVFLANFPVSFWKKTTYLFFKLANIYFLKTPGWVLHLKLGRL